VGPKMGAVPSALVECCTIQQEATRSMSQSTILI
jgi:hypothetical protein